MEFILSFSVGLISFTNEKINFYLSKRYLVIKETRALQAIIKTIV